jgi:NAD(P)-dependent dehydrogenase (short-subunit alcohol dehydrogenase family)
MSYRLNDHVAIVTGNSSGLGKAIGMALGKAGARLPINYCNNRKRAEATLAEYQAAGIESMLVQADVTTEVGVKAV